VNCNLVDTEVITKMTLRCDYFENKLFILGKNGTSTISSISAASPSIGREGTGAAKGAAAATAELDQTAEPQVPEPHTRAFCAAAGIEKQASKNIERKYFIPVTFLFLK
jgi:hypothetical protein